MGPGDSPNQETQIKKMIEGQKDFKSYCFLDEYEINEQSQLENERKALKMLEKTTSTTKTLRCFV